MNELTFEQENDLVLKDILDKAFFKTFQSKKNVIKNNNITTIGLEFFITPDCTQSCSYCYLCKYKDELYPKELRDEDTIVNNLKILLQWCVDNNYNPNRFDFFSGEIWGTQFGNRILDTVLEAHKNGFSPSYIMIPTNFNFLLNEETENNMIHYIEEFNNNSKIRLALSCSVDGLYLESQNRPLNKNYATNLDKNSEEYYDKLFTFCKKYNFAFHPMVSAIGIEKWQDNLKWWMEKMFEYDFNPLSHTMFLEIRDNNWSDEKIIEYLKYLNYSCDYYRNILFPKIFKEDAKSAYKKWVYGMLERKYQGHYSPLKLSSREDLSITCSLPQMLIIRGGDLKIIPCHRMSYDQFNIGQFIVENDKIVDIKCEHLQMANQCWLNDIRGMAQCGECPYKYYCMRGCYGAQYENSGEFLYPCDTVCTLYKVRCIFLYEKYKKINILDSNIFKSINLEELIQSIKETEEYKKWIPIIRQII